MVWATVNDGRTGPGSHIREMSTPGGSPGQEADPAWWLARLRRDYRDWAFLFDPWARVWVAVQGRYRIEMAATPNALHESLGNRRARRQEP